MKYLILSLAMVTLSAHAADCTQEDATAIALKAMQGVASAVFGEPGALFALNVNDYGSTRTILAKVSATGSSLDPKTDTNYLLRFTLNANEKCIPDSIVRQ
jgi:hypothetical protein